MIIYKVKEGNTGILTLIDTRTNEESKFIPNYDFPEAKELYLRFSNFTQGKYSVKQCFMYDDVNMYPFVTSWLYWSFFSQYIKYKNLVDPFLRQEINFIFLNEGKLKQLITSIKTKNKNQLKHKVYNLITLLVNKALVRKKYQMGFFSYGRDDFRVKDMRKVLDQKNVAYLNVLNMIPKRKIIRDIISKRVDYIGIRYFTNKSYFVKTLSFGDEILFAIAFENIQNILSDLAYSYEKHSKVFKSPPFDLFYGIDDNNLNIYPWLLYCRKKGVRTIGHQHGLLTDKQLSYLQPILEQTNEYVWYEKYIVWGSYWKEKILKLSKVYDQEQIIIGCNKTKVQFPVFKQKKDITQKRSLNILIPYEFLANTHMIGRYITNFLELGHKIYFKPRVDERLEDQLEAYCLSEKDIQKVNILFEITDETMYEIDAIAGTFTTLLFDLMIYNKPLWILDTEAKILDELVEEDLAYKLRLNDIYDLRDKLEVKKYEINDFYNNDTLENIIEKYVLANR